MWCISGAPATNLKPFGGCDTLACLSLRRTVVHTRWKVTQESGASSHTRCKAGIFGSFPSSPDHLVFVRVGSCCHVFFLHVQWIKWQNKWACSHLIPLCPKKELHQILINEWKSLFSTNWVEDLLLADSCQFKLNGFLSFFLSPKLMTDVSLLCGNECGAAFTGSQ